MWSVNKRSPGLRKHAVGVHRRYRVGVAVDDLPLVLLQPETGCDPQLERCYLVASADLRLPALILDKAREIRADKPSELLVGASLGRAIAKLRRRPLHRSRHVRPSALRRPPWVRERDVVTLAIQTLEWLRGALDALRAHPRA